MNPSPRSHGNGPAAARDGEGATTALPAGVPEPAWTPLKRGGCSFRSHQLHRVGPERLEFRPHASSFFFCGIFVFGGVIGLVIAGCAARRGDGKTAAGMGFWALLFGGAGVWCWRSLSVPIVFDRSYRAFWRDRRRPEQLAEPAELLGRYTPFDEIAALQLLSERCSSSKGGRFFSHELNLVLRDGSRVQVVDHGSAAALRREAAVLAEFLGGIPVLDRLECRR